MNDLIVIPQLKNSIIARIENDVIIKIAEIEVSLNSRSIITDNNLVVSLCFESKALTCTNPKPNNIYF